MKVIIPSHPTTQHPKLQMNQPVQPPATLSISTGSQSSTKYLDLARKIKEIEMVKKTWNCFLHAFL